MKLLTVRPPPFGMLFTGMKLPEPSVGMSARNCTFALKGVPAASLTTAPMPVPTPGSSCGMVFDSVQGDAPRPVIVTITPICTPVCVMPVVGFVQLVVPSQDADVPVMGRMMRLAGKLAREQGAGDGFRLVVNNGRVGVQEVQHVHLHVLGGPDPLGPMLPGRRIQGD